MARHDNIAIQVVYKVSGLGLIITNYVHDEWSLKKVNFGSEPAKSEVITVNSSITCPHSYKNLTRNQHEELRYTPSITNCWLPSYEYLCNFEIKR